MNRYLFKAKRKDNNEWVYGSLLQEENRSFIGNYIHKILYGEKICFSARNNKKETNKWNSFGLVEVIPETICEYTGLNDKNGKMIFENDILINSITKTKSIVKYYDIRFVLSYIDRLEEVPMYNFMHRMSSLFEIIGNKFDEGDNNE